MLAQIDNPGHGVYRAVKIHRTSPDVGPDGLHRGKAPGKGDLQVSIDGAPPIHASPLQGHHVPELKRLDMRNALIVPDVNHFAGRQRSLRRTRQDGYRDNEWQKARPSVLGRREVMTSRSPRDCRMQKHLSTTIQIEGRLVRKRRSSLSLPLPRLSYPRPGYGNSKSMTASPPASTFILTGRFEPSLTANTWRRSRGRPQML